MARYTAAEARSAAGLTLDEKIDNLLAEIKRVATEKKGRSLRTSWEYKADHDLWVRGGYDKSQDWLEACKVLTDLGYDVEFYYNESQFVDMYTLIKW